jgi:3-oxoacyl-[acyl-carrier-protein] synthase-3
MSFTQANLRISQFVQHKLQLRDDQVYNNIQRYGNTTAASIPIALYEAWNEGKIKDGDLFVLLHLEAAIHGEVH